MSTTRIKWTIIIGLILVAVVSLSLVVFRTGDWESLLLNFGTEMVGAIVTYLLFVLVIGSREKGEDEKRELIESLKSAQIKEVANALDRLRRAGWLIDGSLRGENFHNAFWRGSDFRGADLSGVDLQEARLEYIDFQGAILKGADLRNATLTHSKLHAANLIGAKLLGVNFRRSEFDENTILPNGEKWNSDFDVTSFT